MRELKYNYNIHILVIVEPRVSGQRADVIIDKLGFKNSFRVKAVGFSGGIGFFGMVIKLRLISSAPLDSKFIVVCLLKRGRKVSFLQASMVALILLLDKISGPILQV